MTPAVDNETLDGVSSEYFHNLARDLRTGAFNFKPSLSHLRWEQKAIPKPGKPGKTRDLMMAPPRDKIVQQAMFMILEAIYEPHFRSDSHGFRPGRGCHSALRQVQQQFTAVN